ncbi:MAG: hypothetical protein U0V48_05295 [Anaerolineales bacterium]
MLGPDGVLDAGVVMATQANRDLLAANNLLPESVNANPDDLLIVVKADDDASAEARSVKWMNCSRAENHPVLNEFPPRSLSAAVKQLPEANWVLISVRSLCGGSCGRTRQARFLYSDNVSLEDEISLKKTAREKGLLVMGPRLRHSHHQRHRAGIRQSCAAQHRLGRWGVWHGDAGGDGANP